MVLTTKPAEVIFTPIPTDGSLISDLSIIATSALEKCQQTYCLQICGIFLQSATTQLTA